MQFWECSKELRLLKAKALYSYSFSHLINRSEFVTQDTNVYVVSLKRPFKCALRLLLPILSKEKNTCAFKTYIDIFLKGTVDVLS